MYDEGTTILTRRITLRRGIQYGIVLKDEHSTAIPLARLVPCTIFLECTLSSNETRLSVCDLSSQNAVVETVIGPWDVDAVMNLSTMHSSNQHTGHLYGNHALS